MKKLMALMAGTALALGTVAFAADETKPTTDKPATTSKKNHKKHSKKGAKTPTAPTNLAPAKK
jgi:hypothetical protein